MAKITEYPVTTEIANDDVLLVDGAGGTRGLSVSGFSEAVANKIVDSTAITGLVADIKADIQEKGNEVIDSIPSDYTALQGEVSDLKSEITNSENEINGIRDDLYSAYDVVFDKSFSVATGSYSGSTKVIDVEIPEGTEYTFKLTSTATKSGNMAVYEIYSDSTYKALSYNYTPGSNLTATAAKDTISFHIAVAGGGFTSNGNVSVTVKYTKHNAESVQQDIINLETHVDAIQDNMDEIYHDFIVEIGYDMISEWVSGDIDSNGAEILSTSYYRTGRIDVDTSKSYYLANVTKDDEQTTKVSAWGNNTYGVVHCYSESAYLGVASVGTGNAAGIVTPLENTVYVRIGHTLVSGTTIHMYELNGSTANYREDIIPTGHDDIAVKSFDAETVTETKLSVGQMGFTANSGMTLVNKETAGPWFLYSNNIVSAYIPFSPGSYYIKAVISGLTGIYIKYYDTNKTYLSITGLGSYQTPTKFVAPDGAHYIRVIVAKATPKLSDLTEFGIYRYTSKNLGYSPIHRIVNVNTLPELPPTATTGRNGGGILCLGHGGLSSVYSEDSIESFYGLAHNGFDGSEVDIQFTKDHIPVCWHDGSLSTLDGGTSSDHIYDYTLAELDANFDFRTWWDKRNCFRSTVARFEEVCILARAYGWWVAPDKLTSASGATDADGAALVAMIKKYGIEDKIIVPHSCAYLLEAFPNNPISLTAMQTAVNEAWINGLLNNTIPELCHQDDDNNYIVNDGLTVYTSFNWAIIKAENDVQTCADITDLMTKHNVKTIWYTCETPEDIYQLVKYCPKTAILLTGRFTIPDGMNNYIGMGWGNKRDDLSDSVFI